MKQLLVFILLLLAFFSYGQNIPSRPNPPRLVNDYAHVMDAQQVDALEKKLVAYDDSTSTQIAVITVETLDGYPIEDYARKILREWGVGNKKTNNGIVIVAAIRDHKIRIETGGGMEGSIPDITAKHIINDNIVPNFRNDNYYQGFEDATDAIFLAARGEYKAPEGYSDRGDKRTGGSVIGAVIIFLIILYIIMKIGGGRGGGGMMSRRGFSPFIFTDFGGGGWNSGGGGGGWSGGGGGGFGGFGGGSGGGGGASGSW
ncbi:MAG: TPM domain-containing protein [Chitinophagaceae bacterium]